MRIQHWKGQEIDVVQSKGGVLATVDPWDNVIRTGILPWPPPELIQKLYQSRQARAFSESDLPVLKSKMGFYSDLQSIHSEDSITWSLFGPILYADQRIRTQYIGDLFDLIEIPGNPDSARVWLWRRLPHPDTLVSGGPEIDFGVQTDNVFLLGESKWRSPVARDQGVNKDKDQLKLRHEFCQRYGLNLLPDIEFFVVMGASPNGNMLSVGDINENGVSFLSRDTTWDFLATIDSHPCAGELVDYLHWKAEYAKRDNLSPVESLKQETP